MLAKESPKYNQFAIWTVGVCLIIIIGNFVLGSLLDHVPFQTRFDVCTLIAILGAVQCHRIGGGISDFILLSISLDQHSRPWDANVIEFSEQLEQHPRWLTSLAGIGYLICYTHALCGIMLALVLRLS
jgi:hypothetical protein